MMTSTIKWRNRARQSRGYLPPMCSRAWFILGRKKGKLITTYGDEFQDMVMGFCLEKGQVGGDIVLGIPLASYSVPVMIEGGHPAIK